MFEGMALGVASRQSSAWFLLLAFASHKWVISGTLGLKWARSALRPMIAVLYMTVFCIVSPIGIGIGMALTDPSQEESANGVALIVVQVIGASSGFIFMVLLGLAEVRGSNESETPIMLN